MKFQRFVKRQMDFWIAGGVLIVLAVPFLCIALLIKLDSAGPVFFIQERVGKGGKKFMMLKFRSMVPNAVHLGRGIEVEKNDARITRVGKVLRRLALDEAPQLLHVLKGEMSLVGPRPALPHQVEQYSKEEQRRLEVKPGLANMAMMKGWNTLSWKERIDWDVWYIDHWSLFLDFKILLSSLFSVFSGKGQYGAEGVVEDYK
jgi:lipopolysaccharide/colanic/teichoic acid biosynthesis glycosyltransferase